MQKDEAKACVGTGCGIAHIASTVNDRGSCEWWVKGKARVRLRTSAGEGDLGLTCGMTIENAVELRSALREQQYL